MLLTIHGVLSTISAGMYTNNQHLLLYVHVWRFVGFFFLKSLPIERRSFSCELLVFFPLFPCVVSFSHTFYVFPVGI